MHIKKGTGERKMDLFFITLTFNRKFLTNASGIGGNLPPYFHSLEDILAKMALIKKHASYPKLSPYRG